MKTLKIYIFEERWVTLECEAFTRKEAQRKFWKMGYHVDITTIKEKYDNR